MARGLDSAQFSWNARRPKHWRLGKLPATSYAWPRKTKRSELS